MRKAIIKALTWFAGLTLLLSACAIDSDSLIPFTTALISIGWLGLVAWANDWGNI